MTEQRTDHRDNAAIRSFDGGASFRREPTT
jgi:hypothetical protein